MVGDGTIAETPEQLGAWIEGRPEVKESLEMDGYGTEFTADDLFPLLQVFIVQAGGPAPQVDAPPRAALSRGVLLAVAAGVVIVLLVLAAAIAT
jgi:hypothetical protein